MSDQEKEIFAYLSEVLDNLKILDKKISIKHSSSRQAQILNLIECFNSIAESDIYSKGNQRFGEYTMSLIISHLKHLKKYSSLEKISSNKYKFDLILSKICFLIKSLPNSFNLSESDFECLPIDDPRKQLLLSKSTIITLDQDLISKQIVPFIKAFNILKAVYFKTCKFKGSKFKDLLISSYLLYFSFNYKACKKVVIKSNLKSDLDSIYQL